PIETHTTLSQSVSRRAFFKFQPTFSFQLFQLVVSVSTATSCSHCRHCTTVFAAHKGSLLRRDGSRRPRSHRNCLLPYGWFLLCSGLEAAALRRARHRGQSLHPVRCGVQESSQAELCPHPVLGLPRRVCRARRHLSARSGAFLRGRSGSAGVLCRIPWKAQG
ncbi:unnamed protein product, partial [Ixodes pacificus]